MPRRPRLQRARRRALRAGGTRSQCSAGARRPTPSRSRARFARAGSRGRRTRRSICLSVRCRGGGWRPRRRCARRVQAHARDQDDTRMQKEPFGMHRTQSQSQRRHGVAGASALAITSAQSSSRWRVREALGASLTKTRRRQPRSSGHLGSQPRMERCHPSPMAERAGGTRAVTCRVGRGAWRICCTSRRLHGCVHASQRCCSLRRGSGL
mmetsp:Transcript_3442/g.12360  ORF Transcript_3442/g.12360 Transcript_3442/m.12360 type:complete len:210 (-) Transcript_3442:1650-2279(-)